MANLQLRRGGGVIESAAGQAWTAEQVELIKDMCCKGGSDNELAVLLHMSRKTGLDPLARQVHSVPRFDKTLGHKVRTIQVGIDGFRLVANRTKAYAGNDDPVFVYDAKKNVIAATVTVYKVVQGLRCPFTVTARWSEYYPGEKLGFMWLQKPHVMLGKCAEALALRKAFPMELSGLYTEEEMDAAQEGAQTPAEEQPVQVDMKVEDAPPPQDDAPSAPVDTTARPATTRIEDVDIEDEFPRPKDTAGMVAQILEIAVALDKDISDFLVEVSSFAGRDGNEVYARDLEQLEKSPKWAQRACHEARNKYRRHKMQ